MTKKQNNIEFVDVVELNIKEVYSHEAAAALLQNKELHNWHQYDDNAQRGLVNRILINKLLMFRATHNVPVTDVIYCLVPDGDNESWMTVFKLVILPFLKENKVSL